MGDLLRIATAFAHDTPEAASTQWRNIAEQIRLKVSKLASLMDSTEQDVLAYMTFPKAALKPWHSAPMRLSTRWRPAFEMRALIVVVRIIGRAYSPHLDMRQK
ncbi:hypothetical protein FHT28_006883 [Rhizobium sp. SG570]|nr:hypothetical protein [Rhizobium sp. SG570]